jgi:hypothetical protein
VKGTDHLGDLGMDGRVIINQILKYVENGDIGWISLAQNRFF